MSKTKTKTNTLVLGAVFTALVIVLQYLGTFIRFGPFAISLVLVPIVIGAATCGTSIGTWLGFVFGIVVLASGDASAFLTVNFVGTIITVLLKGAACGFASGLVYKLLKKRNKILATIAAAVACPVVNTAVFLLGCFVFFFETITVWGISAGFENMTQYIIFGLVGANFLVELAVNVVLSPVIIRILGLIRSQTKNI